MSPDAATELRRYNAGAMVLHWLIAALLIGNIALAWYFNTLSDLAKAGPTQLHKSIGITVLIPSLARLAWRLLYPHPPLPVSVKGWERIAAEAVYLLFYRVMLGMPLTGWAMTSASPLIRVYPITLFGLVHWPAMGPLTALAAAPMHRAHRLFMNAHGLLAKLAYALIVLHVGAALLHQFVRRDDIVWRMVPFVQRPMV